VGQNQRSLYISAFFFKRVLESDRERERERDLERERLRLVLLFFGERLFDLERDREREGERDLERERERDFSFGEVFSSGFLEEFS
jgi:hypothetical protein